MMVPLIFVLFVIPGVVHGYVAGTVKTHRDVVAGMTDAMGTMAYYLVMVFFAAQFIAAFNGSNIGLLIVALKGANFLRDLKPVPAGHDRRHHPADRGGQRVRRLGLGQVGAAVEHLRADADGTWGSPPS